jgi:TonB family protein
MMKSVILAVLVLVATPSVAPLRAESSDSGSVTKPSTGRTWTLSELDTLSGHKWVWRDPSFKEVVLQTLDSLPDELPCLKKNIAYDYPEQARRKQVEADVAMRVLIDKKGKARAAYVQMDSGHEGIGFEEAALRVARENRREPAYLHDEPMAIWVTYKNQFRLMTTSAGDPVTKVGKWEWWVIEEEPSTQLTVEPPSEPAPAAKDVSDSTNMIALEELPEAIKLPSPIYPTAAVSLRIQSSVQVKILIDKKGKVRRATIMTPSERPGYGFEESALRAALDGKWKPAMEDGKPVAVWVSYPISYLLKAPKHSRH